MQRNVRPSDVYLVQRLMHVTDEIETGKLARNARKAARLSLREVARRMKLSAPYVSDLELGRRKWNETILDRFRSAICGRETLPTKPKSVGQQR